MWISPLSHAGRHAHRAASAAASARVGAPADAVDAPPPPSQRGRSSSRVEKGSLRATWAIYYARARTQSGGTRVAAWIAVRERTTSKSAASAARLRGVWLSPSAASRPTTKAALSRRPLASLCSRNMAMASSTSTAFRFAAPAIVARGVGCCGCSGGCCSVKASGLTSSGGTCWTRRPGAPRDQRQGAADARVAHEARDVRRVDLEGAA